MNEKQKARLKKLMSASHTPEPTPEELLRWKSYDFEKYVELRQRGDYTSPNLPREGALCAVARRKERIAEFEKRYPDFRSTYDEMFGK